MIEAILLGVAQDAGVPQLGCKCLRCHTARRVPAQRRFAVSLALVDHPANRFWLIDATPDFREQLDGLWMQYPEYTLAGIWLTHTHIGHYTGLIHLGKESLNTREVPIYATESVLTFLRENKPWHGLFEAGNVVGVMVAGGTPHTLTNGLRVVPVPVPHRDEWSDTVAYRLEGHKCHLFYCPDIDSWDVWAHDIRIYLADIDVALLDATFFSSDELPGRDLTEIPHPLAQDTVKRLTGTTCSVGLIHLNHSNPLLDADSAARRWVEEAGFFVGKRGMRWQFV